MGTRGAVYCVDSKLCDQMRFMPKFAFLTRALSTLKSGRSKLDMVVFSNEVGDCGCELKHTDKVHKVTVPGRM